MKKLTLFLSLVLILAGCKKDDPKPVGPDIYISGMAGVNSLYFVAKYWKNGTETVVDNRTVPNAYVNSMAVSGTDVYLAGYQLNGTTTNASYWKDKVPTTLTGAIANSIATDGTDVYVAGIYYNINGLPVAAVWKNGVATPLTNGTNDGYVYSVAMSGTDVYAAGYDGNVAVYWKNGIPTQLTNGQYQAWTVSIAISGHDVYTLGYEYSATSNDAKYWKNGTPINLADGSTTELHQIIVDGNDVYACGSTSNTAVYWKNGVAVSLTDGTHTAGAMGIAVYKGDVYVVGFEDDNNGVRIGKLWKNGVATSFAGTDVSTEPSAIIVK